MINFQIFLPMCKLGRIHFLKLEEWGIYKLGGVDFDTLTKSDIVKLDEFIKAENGYTSERRFKKCLAYKMK